MAEEETVKRQKVLAAIKNYEATKTNEFESVGAVSAIESKQNDAINSLFPSVSDIRKEV